MMSKHLNEVACESTDSNVIVNQTIVELKMYDIYSESEACTAVFRLPMWRNGKS